MGLSITSIEDGMGKRCAICDDPDRLAIDKAILTGKSIPVICREMGLDGKEQAMYRHRASHVRTRVMQAAIEAPTIEPVPDDAIDTLPIRDKLSAYDDICYARSKAIKLLETVEANPDSSIYDHALALREVRETVKLLASMYEMQKRIEAAYANPDTLNASFIWRWMSQRCPEILAEMVEDARRADAG